MKDALLLFEFLDENSERGNYIDVVPFLASIGYITFHEQKAFLNAQKSMNYISENFNPLSPYYADETAIAKNPGMKYKIMIRLTPHGEEYHDKHKSRAFDKNVSQENLKIAGKNLTAMWIGIGVAILSILVNIYLFYLNAIKENQIAKQEAIINQLQSKISSLTTQIDSSSKAQLQMIPPPKKTSKPKTDLK